MVRVLGIAPATRGLVMDTHVLFAAGRYTGLLIATCYSTPATYYLVLSPAAGTCYGHLALKQLE
ncbi:hypothetical protein PspLS_06705 [Pyricularia sp. CBS 133598]|nr:hypothetical protein PspLS_06705 [Pyricularia sp. CBS 133598]